MTNVLLSKNKKKTLGQPKLVYQISHFGQSDAMSDDALNIVVIEIKFLTQTVETHICKDGIRYHFILE